MISTSFGILAQPYSSFSMQNKLTAMWSWPAMCVAHAPTAGVSAMALPLAKTGPATTGVVDSSSTKHEGTMMAGNAIRVLYLSI